MLVAASIFVLTAVVVAIMHHDKTRDAVKVKAKAKDRRDPSGR
jgi:hypothetical protein